MVSSPWLALAIGNSRYHWAYFVGSQLQRTWDTPHLQEVPGQSLGELGVTVANLSADLSLPAQPDLWIASVVPAQTQLWSAYPSVHFLTLEQVPLLKPYPTLGIDRALAVWGAIDRLGAPVLVIDGGTALTFTAANADRELLGGAILPGLQLQFRALGQATAALPQLEVGMLTTLPPVWANNTKTAIQSGILRTLVAGVERFVSLWWQQFPEGAVVLTGGDGEVIFRVVQQEFPTLAARIEVDRQLIFRGMRAVRAEWLESII